jgi:ArsR family transcriptional regulator, arsenate/arsenite/antimonite-responsive transcriptional repressor
MVALLPNAMEHARSRRGASDADAHVSQLPTETAHGLAGLFKLLSDETRLRILYFLMQQEEINVRTFCRLLGQSQPAVSHHLAMLKEARLIECRRDGKHNFYRVIPQRMQQFADLLFGGPPEQPRRFRLDDCVLTYARDP